MPGSVAEKCKNCGAPFGVDELHCEYCGTHVPSIFSDSMLRRIKVALLVNQSTLELNNPNDSPPIPPQERNPNVGIK